MALTRIYIAAALIVLSFACSKPEIKHSAANTTPASSPTHKLEIADHFAYPVSSGETVTAKKDKDGWFKELEFGKDGSLGEHWTLDAGDNGACGEPVYAVANGNVIYAEFAGPEWE
jgi:hypothetical protein